MTTLDSELTDLALSPDFQKNPYPFYRAVLDRPGWTAPSRQRVFGRYADVEEILLSPDRFRQEPGPSFHNTDPPDHTRMRRAVATIFSPRAIKGYRDRIAELSRKLIDRFIDRGRVDLIEEYAIILPGMVIADMLGAPQRDRLLLMEWLAPMFELAGRETFTAGSSQHSADMHRMTGVLHEQHSYFADLLANARADSDNSLAILRQAIETGKMSEQEALDTLVLMLAAGLHTTVNQIGNTMLALLRNPAQLAIVRRTGDVSSAVEEGLRYESSAQAEYRDVHVDTTIGDVSVAAGTRIMIIYAAANRDPTMFPDPDRFDVMRDNARRHLGFAKGIHLCLGAPLARAEMEIGLAHLIDRLPDIRLDGEPVLTGHWRHRGLARLPVAWRRP